MLPAAPETDRIAVADVLMREYEALKAEQTQRTSTRDNLIYATLLSIGAAIGGAVQAKFATMLLLLPPVCFILGWTYLVNDQKISAIGAYLREDLSVRLGSLVEGPVLGWEKAHRADRRRTGRKTIQLVIDLLTFVAPAAGALVAYWVLGRPSPMLIVSLFEVAGCVLLVHQMIVHADLRRDLPASEGGGL